MCTPWKEPKNSDFDFVNDFSMNIIVAYWVAGLSKAIFRFVFVLVVFWRDALIQSAFILFVVYIIYHNQKKLQLSILFSLNRYVVHSMCIILLKSEKLIGPIGYIYIYFFFSTTIKQLNWGLKRIRAFNSCTVHIPSKDLRLLSRSEDENVCGANFSFVIYHFYAIHKTINFSHFILIDNFL